MAVRSKLVSPSNFAAVPNGVSSLNGLLSKLQSEGDACSKLNRRIFSARSLTARLSSPEAAEVLQLGNVSYNEQQLLSIPE